MTESGSPGLLSVLPFWGQISVYFFCLEFLLTAHNCSFQILFTQMTYNPISTLMLHFTSSENEDKIKVIFPLWILP